MSRNPPIPTAKAFAWRLAVFYAALFTALGVQLPFLPVWLAARGLDAGEIGLALALPMIVRVIAIPLATAIADRRDVVRGTLAVAATAAVAGYAAAGLVTGVAAILATLTLAACFYTPLMPLADAYALRGVAERGVSYGPVRLWGSAAFIGGSFGAGLLLEWIAPGNLIWLLVAAMLPAAFAACALRPLSTGARAWPKRAASAWPLLRSPAFLLVALAASLIQASHAVYYGFSALDWQADGLDSTAVGALWALGVVAEIVLFAVSGRLRLGPIALLVLGGAGGFVRWGAMAFDPAPLWLPLLQCLHALSFGATHLGAMAFMLRAAPAEIGATAQGYLAVGQGLVMAVAMGLAGLLYARYGNLAYAAMALMAAAGAASALTALRLAKRASGASTTTA
jgi:PPP family 3-phenylpropionic acid transporter